MKKVFPLLCAVTIVSSPFVVHAQIEEINQTVEAEQTTEVNQTEDASNEPSQLEVIKELTLEDVIRRGIENSKNLIVLQLNLEVTKNELLKTDYDKNKTAQDIRKLEERIDQLKNKREELSKEEKIKNGKERIGIKDSIKVLENEIKSLETAVLRLKSGQLQLQMQEEEAKEGVQLILTSYYTELLFLQKQITLTKKSLQNAMNDVNKYQLLYKLGRVSQEKLQNVQIAKEDAKRRLEQQEKSYRQNLADLSYKIGITYQPDMVIKPIGFEPVDFVKPKDYNMLIENSYKMKRTQKSLESAILNRIDVYREYEEGNATIYDKVNQDYLVKIAEQTIGLTNDELQTSIEQLYRNGEDSYSSYKEAVRQLEIKKKELDVLKIRYKLGRASKYDYEQAQIDLQQAELKVYEAKVQNYTIQQSIEALQKGYVQ